MSGLGGKVALITGAGGMRGIGRATALHLARQGAAIALTDVDRDPQTIPPNEVELGWQGLTSVAEEVRAIGAECLTRTCDLGKSAEIEKLVEEVQEHFGHIDILVNNARALIGKANVPITDLPEEVFEEFLSINTTAVFLLTKLVGREMIRQGQGGRIVNIGSLASKQASPKQTAYAASKFAVLGITQSSALDLAPYGITVNAVCPGAINTDRFSYDESAKASSLGITQEELRARINQEAAAGIPLGRVAEAEEVANLVGFLISEQAAYITGQAYNINGGTIFH
jgi:NAD(P)-dependent dehydrogenase (short-subunit alcohol dehydrogenase family)